MGTIMSGSYRKLIRNLRAGNHLRLMRKLKMNQPPIELEALTALLREEGLLAHLREPGFRGLPPRKAPVWRIECHARDNKFEISMANGRINITRIITINLLVDAQTTSPTFLQAANFLMFYESSGPGDRVTPAPTKIKSVDLADPQSTQKITKIINEW